MPAEIPVRKPGAERVKGYAFVWLLNLLQALVSIPFAIGGGVSGTPTQAVIQKLALISLLPLGLTQLTYVLPVVILARRKGREQFVIGATTAASITFLLSSTCWVLIWTSK